MTIRTIFAALAAAVLGFAAPAFAADGWSGEGAISAAATTGNTETTDLGLSPKGARQMGDWRVKTNAAADHGETNSNETRNRWGPGGQVDRDITHRFYLFGGATYELDQVSGYEPRLYVGPGAGYRVLTGERTK
jgi:putative salt-induced outer membrane protein YdiY